MVWLVGDAGAVKHVGWRAFEDHDPVEDSEWYRRELAATLRRAAIELRVQPQGLPQFGWRDRSVGVRVDDDGDPAWLRLVVERADRDMGVFWDGNATASVALSGMRLPRLLRSWEREEAGRRCRADLMTYIDQPVCSPTAALTGQPELAEAWWMWLAGTLSRLAASSTRRVAVDLDDFAGRITVWDPELPVTVDRWVPAHGDLHWGQLTGPDFWILDWEGWGLAPSGFDAASLYLHSLAVPPIADLVRLRYAEQLDSRDGMLSQLYLAGRMLDRDDLPDRAAEAAVFAEAGRLLDALGASPQAYAHLRGPEARRT
ncbi:hypothetical protein [Actinoplanes sp. NPDC049316]|uniref:hypothetical protein n=1 Tax=Actinoplanes sp. NPDC049316 TaxID=3154727 RepID=UPI00342B88CC